VKAKPSCEFCGTTLNTGKIDHVGDSISYTGLSGNVGEGLMKAVCSIDSVKTGEIKTLEDAGQIHIH
jgi:ABC-type iron transport system FetAB ATPase subunit